MALLLQCMHDNSKVLVQMLAVGGVDQQPSCVLLLVMAMVTKETHCCSSRARTQLLPRIWPQCNGLLCYAGLPAF